MAKQELEEVFRDYFYSLLSADAAPGEHERHREAVRHRLKQAGYLSTPDPRDVGIIPTEALERMSERALEQRQRPTEPNPESLRQRWQGAAGEEQEPVVHPAVPSRRWGVPFLLLSALVMALLVATAWYLLPVLYSPTGGQAVLLPSLYRFTALPIYRLPGGQQ